MEPWFLNESLVRDAPGEVFGELTKPTARGQIRIQQKVSRRILGKGRAGPIWLKSYPFADGMAEGAGPPPTFPHVPPEALGSQGPRRGRPHDFTSLRLWFPSLHSLLRWSRLFSLSCLFLCWPHALLLHAEHRDGGTEEGRREGRREDRRDWGGRGRQEERKGEIDF